MGKICSLKRPFFTLFCCLHRTETFEILTFLGTGVARGISTPAEGVVKEVRLGNLRRGGRVSSCWCSASSPHYGGCCIRMCVLIGPLPL